MFARRNAERGLDTYLDSIVGSTPLSGAQEVALAKRIAKGNMDAMDARNKLVAANLRFVVSTAKQFQYRGLSMAELISAGNQGLMTAAERFDGTRGFKFITYAVWWIRQAMQQALDEQSLVHMPLSQRARLRKIARVSSVLRQRLGRDPELWEIAAEIGDTLSETETAIQVGHPILSFDGSCHVGADGDDSQPLIEVLPDPDTLDIDASISAEELRHGINDALECLDERERNIICMYFGLDGEDPMTLQEIGGLMGLTRERVRQLKERALNKLRKPGRCERLEAIAG